MTVVPHSKPRASRRPANASAGPTLGNQMGSAPAVFGTQVSGPMPGGQIMGSAMAYGPPGFGQMPSVPVNPALALGPAMYGSNGSVKATFGPPAYGPPVQGPFNYYPNVQGPTSSGSGAHSCPSPSLEDE